MELVNSLIEFFGIDLISQAATFTDVLNVLLKVGVGVWLTLFICKCLFMACTIGDRRFY